MLKTSILMLREYGLHRRVLSGREGTGNDESNFDVFLEEQLRDPEFAERFKRAGAAWEVALQIAALREKVGLSQKDLARKLKTSQQTDQPFGVARLRRAFSEHASACGACVECRSEGCL